MVYCVKRFLQINKDTTSFCYLGRILTRGCTDDEDVEARIEKAGGAFGSLRKSLFANASITFQAKKAVYEGLVLSILLYGAESWCLTEKLFNFHARCARAMCRITRWHVRKHSIRTEDLLTRLGLKSIDAYVTKRHLQWAGHVRRMPFDRLPRKLMSSWVQSKRPIGCPSFTYGRGLYKSPDKAGVNKEEWPSLAQDREIWREIINSLV